MWAPQQEMGVKKETEREKEEQETEQEREERKKRRKISRDETKAREGSRQEKVDQISTQSSVRLESLGDFDIANAAARVN